MSEGSVLETTVRIAATPEQIFPYLVDPDLMVRWMGSEVLLAPRPGGIYHVKISEQAIASGEFKEVQPNRKVVFTFGWEGEENSPEPGSTTVEISLEPDGDETVVRLLHSGLTPEEIAPHTEGWKHFLARLTRVAVGEEPGEDSMAAGGDM